MDKQEIFDKVAVHLLTQMKKAIARVGCVYRAPDGCKCAIGCLIPDEKYRPEFDNGFGAQAGTGSVSVHTPELLRACGVSPSLASFLEQLQEIHDRYYPQNWDYKLRLFADQHNLSTAAIDNMRQS